MGQATEASEHPVLAVDVGGTKLAVGLVDSAGEELRAERVATPTGEVSPLNIPGWRGFPLRRRLAQHLRCDVRVHNDAVCLAVAEHWRGAASGFDHGGCASRTRRQRWHRRRRGAGARR